VEQHTSCCNSRIGADKKGLAEEKSQKAQAEESKATAETDLAAAVKKLAESKDNMANGNSMCMQTAADHDASLADRAEELHEMLSAAEALQSEVQELRALNKASPRQPLPKKRKKLRETHPW
jgi:hypothetical protein